MIAASTLSFGMLTARAFWITRRSAGFEFGVGAARLDRDRDFLADAGELLRHAVPAREHRVLADFEDASHGNSTCLEGRAIYLSARRGPIGPTAHHNNWQNESVEMPGVGGAIVKIQ